MILIEKRFTHTSWSYLSRCK